MKTTSYLTPGYDPKLAAKIRKTHPGQAHWAGSGPSGATCGDCVHLGYYRKHVNFNGDATHTQWTGGCAEFHRLTGKHGPVIRQCAEACRHFRRRDDKDWNS